MGRLKVLVYENGGNVAQCLAALVADGAGPQMDLYCAPWDMGRRDELAESCAAGQKSGLIQSLEILPLESSFEALANELFLNGGESEGFLFFLSSSVIPEAGCLARLLGRLEGGQELAGVNPVLQAGWRGGKELAHLGTVVDCQKQLHYLYEGLAADSPLARKRRFFQIAHPGCLLIRQRDFMRAGGFQTRLGPLAFPILCMELKKLGPKGFCSEPEARGSSQDRFDSWRFCGTWNSILQRGRLDTKGLEPDYIFRATEDGLEYGLDDWLNEGADLPLRPDNESQAQLEWRRHPGPESLIAFISSLSGREQQTAMAVARDLPASLPRVFAYYLAQCAKIEVFGRERGLAQLVEQTEQWRRKRLRFHHGLLKPGMELLRRAGIYNCALDQSPAVFDAWVELAEKFARLDVRAEWPRIAVVMPVWNPEPEFLRQAVESVLGQKYENWQLCIADDASTDPRIGEMLRGMTSAHRRISLIMREKNGHISRATNSALELVDAPFVAFMDQDDTLAAEALGSVADTVARHVDAGYIYSDEDKIDRDNVRRTPIFKPAFDMDLFYTGHLSVFATRLVRQVGGLRTGLEGSQDFDLALRICEGLQPGQILHIPQILYHWRVHENSTAGTIASKPYVLEATKRAWLESAARRGHKAEIGPAGKSNAFRLAWPLPECPCSIILLADEAGPNPDLLKWLEELKERVDLEVLAQPLKQEIPTHHYDRLGAGLLPYAGAGWLDACKGAAKEAEGRILLFLYAGLAPLPGGRPAQLLAAAALPEIAMAGGMIWQKGRLVHGGLYPDISGLPFVLARGMPKFLTNSYVWGEYMFPRHVVGVPWQCMALRREFCGDDFLDSRLGDLALADFSLRHARQNLHTMITPWAQWETHLAYFNPGEEEKRIFAARWGEAIKQNGLRNANLRRAPDDDWTLIM